jgi:uncharacterized repeat protein (TIGR01451 family)
VLPKHRSRAAGAISCAAVAAALCAPAATAAAVPATAAPHALLQAAGSSTYSALSDGSLVFANAANLAPADIAKASTGQSSAGVAVPSGLGTSDQLLQPLLAKSTTGKTAYGHGSGLNVGLLGTQTAPPQVALTTVEATSPAPSSATGDLLTLPADPLVSATVLPGSAVANTTADNSCVVGKDISNGAAHVANATAVTPTAGTSVAALGGTSDTLSRTKLVVPTKADGTTVASANSGLLAQTTQVLAPITLFKGVAGAETTITLLGPLQLSAAAGGLPGTSVVSYAVVGKGPNDPVVTITSSAGSQTLTSQQLFGNGGIVLPLGVADVTIGTPAHALTGLEGSAVGTSADGTSASAAADFVRVTVPGKLPVPGTNPVGGPLAPVLNPVLNPVLSGLSSATSQLQSALTSAGLNVADVRLGHLEAHSTVPVGGIDCSTANTSTTPTTVNPLDESRKDVSALNVQPGSTFQYDIRIPNRGTSPITNLKAMDTYSSGLQFVSSVPAPTSTGSNTLTYSLGTLAPNAFTTIVLTFKVPTSAKAGTVYHNEAVITGTYAGRPVTTTVSVDGPTVGPARVGDCNLSGSTKFASNTRVKTGENFGYFVNVLNSGGKPCLNTVVSDTLVKGVSFVSCTGGCTHNGQVVTWKLGTINPGDSRVVSVVVKVTATSGTLPNAADVTSPSGTGGHPTTPGPVVTSVSTPAPGNPADGPNGSLPRTGLPAGPAALGLALLSGAGIALKLRRRPVGAL